MAAHLGPSLVIGTSAAWRRRVTEGLWDGRPAAALATVEALRSRSPVRCKAKHTLITYLTNNRERIDYPRYRDLGLPCGSGEVEAQCKALVQARCKQPGMRWGRSGARRCFGGARRRATAASRAASPGTRHS